MQPTPPPSPDPAATSNPVVEFVRTDRQSAGFVLLGLAVLLLALCGWTVFKSTRADAAVPEPDAQKKADDPFSLDEGPLKPKDPARNDYIVGGILSAGGFLVAVAAALWLLASVPAPTDARQRADARALILAVGGLIGALLIVAGVWYFYRWSGALADWREKDKEKEARWVLYPLLMLVTGAGLMFLSAQPARAEERNNSTLRKLVYGTNMGLSVLLLFVALVVFNLFLGPRLPNKLDVTETGFYSLSTGSKEFLGRLDQPVTAYAVFPEGGSQTAEDARRLLQNCQDVSNGKFQVRMVSPVSNKSEYRTLAAKYPVLETNETGVLVTVGEDEKRHSFIREDEFSHRDAASAPGAEGGRSFVGEARLMRELLFLSESEKKAVVYFTQQAGELNLDPPQGDEVGPGASAARLKAYLERNYLEVRPLRFDPAAPKVPDDAAVVVVAEPTAPLSEAHVAALRQYMTEPRGTKKGKLVVLAGARFGAKDRVLPTGLEGLLLEFNVRLGDRLVLSEFSRELELPPEVAAVIFTPNAVKARNPVAMALGEKAVFLAQNWRPVAPVPGGGPAYRALPLLMTSPGRVNWLEEEQPRDIRRIGSELNASAAVRAAKGYLESPRPVGVAVSEGESGRVAVIGNGLIVSDAFARQGREVTDPIAFDLVGGTVDWLRDRPALAIGVESKKYKTFALPPTADETRGLWFPLLFALMVVTGMGASVWVIRRRAT